MDIFYSKSKSIFEAVHTIVGRSAKTLQVLD